MERVYSYNPVARTGPTPRRLVIHTDRPAWLQNSLLQFVPRKYTVTADPTH